ncbi:hypothetical protein [Streptomyces iconiensis]|uniref:Ricin B lectin domain-containing protein n=1 Tax=Streptomyces iconiensis TaxID=1384038 RepID=A0ABT6ZSP7_9ACTN|nr:hypothetical protein [Streptomyces iconiensis]MDJ1132070.1 hypothetical protein [Streptomyces iconiensis]
MVSLPLPQGPQMIVQSVTGMHITPFGWSDSDVPAVVWRDTPTTPFKPSQWEFIPEPGYGDRVARIRNAAYDKSTGAFDRSLSLIGETPENGAAVVSRKSDSKSEKQLWRLISMDSAQADFVIAPLGHEGLVINTRQSYQAGNAILQLEEVGPWTDQFWRWQEVRG